MDAYLVSHSSNIALVDPEGRLSPCSRHRTSRRSWLRISASSWRIEHTADARRRFFPACMNFGAGLRTLRADRLNKQ